MLVDVPSRHDGANDGDDDAPATVVDKRTNQPVIKYHGHKAKLTVRLAMTNKDGNGHKISACPRIENPMGMDMGLSLCPRARAWV